MESKKGKFTIEILMERPGGELIFKPIRASRDDLRELIEATTNPVIKHNIETRAKEKRVRGLKK